MEQKQIIINPIGIIHTPHNDIKNMPIQPIAAKGINNNLFLLHSF